MKERLSKQARRMCRQCHFRSPSDGTCAEEGISISEQNTRAKEGSCKRAVIQGGTFGHPLHKLDTVLGDMVRLKDRTWIFEGRDYTRYDEPGMPKSDGFVRGPFVH